MINHNNNMISKKKPTR